MIKIILTKDIKSPWNELKTLPRGREITVEKSIGRKLIEEDSATPVIQNELIEIRKNKKTK